MYNRKINATAAAISVAIDVFKAGEEVDLEGRYMPAEIVAVDDEIWVRLVDLFDKRVQRWVAVHGVPLEESECGWMGRFVDIEELEEANLADWKM